MSCRFVALAALTLLAVGSVQAPPNLNLLVLGGQLDPALAQELAGRGYRVVERSYLANAVTLEQLQRFHVVILGSLPDLYGGGVYEPDGLKLLEARKTLAAVNEYVRQGGGAFFISQTSGGGQAAAEAMSQALEPWGIAVLGEQVRDSEHQVGNHSWTEAIAPHPATEGVKRVYYPVNLMRWDDAYATNPLVLHDLAWQPLVRGEASSVSSRNVAGSYSDEGWTPAEGGPAPVLLAVRDWEQGRLAATGIGAQFLLWNVSSTAEWIGENRTGPIDWIALRKGDGQTPSDLGRLLDQLLHWLAAPGRAKGFGGELPPFGPDEVEEAGEAPAWTKIDWDTVPLPPTWAHTAMVYQYGGTYYYPEVPDVLVEGPVRYFKALIGAHTAYSDGQGTVAEFAQAAREAGYSCLVFTENFADLTPEEWQQLRRDCAAVSDGNFVALAGLDLADPYGNRFLLFGQTNYPPPQALTPDGKAIVQTQFFSLGFANHIAAVHRATSTPLIHELHKHFFGWVVYTYRGGQLVDNSFPGYQWQVVASSNPIPLVAHETYAPADVAKEAQVGYQQILPGSSVTQAVHYFRHGLPHYFANPVRYFLSEGPIIDGWTILNKDEGRVEDHRDHWRLGVGATSDVPIAEVLLFDGYTLSRRWTPNATEFRTTVDGWHDRQHTFLLVVRDAQGRTALSPGIRTVPRGYVVRCGDRQNWFGSGSLGYTGTLVPGYDIRVPAFGTNEGRGLWGNQQGPARGENMAPIKDFPYASDALTVHEYQLDQRYTRALWEEVVFDAKPSHDTARSRVYAGRVRLYDFHGGPVLEQVDLRLRQPVDVREPLFPILTQEDLKKGLVLADAKTDSPPLEGGARGGNADASGEHPPSVPPFQRGGGAVDLAGRPYADLPAGSRVGSLVVLTKGLRVDSQGNVGFAAEPFVHGALPTDTAWHAELVRVDLEKWPDPRSAMGLAGPTPYQLQLTRGTLEQVAYVAHLQAQDSGVAGAVVPAQIGYDLPLAIRGVNPYWDAAVWRPGQPLVFFGVFERIGWARLDVSQEGPFYAGNVLRCDAPLLRLSLVRWDANSIRFEAHNPTDAAIETTVETPPEITDHYHLSLRIAVPAGTTHYYVAPVGGSAN